MFDGKIFECSTIFKYEDILWKEKLSFKTLLANIQDCQYMCQQESQYSVGSVKKEANRVFHVVYA